MGLPEPADLAIAIDLYRDAVGHLPADLLAETIKSCFRDWRWGNRMPFPVDLTASIPAEYGRRQRVLASLNHTLASEARKAFERKPAGKTNAELSEAERQANSDRLEAFLANDSKPPAPKAKSRRKMKPLSQMMSGLDTAALKALHSQCLTRAGARQDDSGDDGAGDGQDDVAGR